ncbi:MAG: stalk domain-containing protein [Oscillospiraceae bacterium]|nr:stalk domain-containing protein [Oscillospiraceae bacterium]
MKRFQRSLALLLAVFLLFGLAAPVSAAREVSVVLDGTPLTFDVAPQIVQGRTMVPVRGIFEALGAEVEWDSATRTVTATAENDDVITMVIGSTALTVNGTDFQMDAAPFTTGGRTLAPARFVAYAIGATVEWDPATWTVLLTSGGTRTLAQYNMSFRLADASGIEVHDFHLGNGEVIDWAGRPHAAPLAGVIAVPDTPGPHPLVVVLHGNALGGFDEDIHARVYSGFGYLVQQLAAEGYVAVSINVSIDYSIDYGESHWGSYAYAVFEQHLERLEQANDGQDADHGVDLAGMIDFDELHIIGHSRGGELADIFVRRDQAAGIDRIRSIIRLAPTVLPYWEDDDAPHPDIPVGIILPEFDGDVQFLDGQAVFDEVMAEARNQSILSLVFLRGANHNWFNSFITTDDAARFDSFAENYRLTRAEQEHFLAHYAAAFLAMTSGGRAPWGAFDVSLPQPVTMFGHDVIASTYVPGLRSVLATPAAGVPAATATGSATAAFYEQGWNADGFFNHPTVLGRQDPRLPLYDLQWTGTDGAVSFSLLNGNFAGHQALSIYVAMDSSNALNQNGQDQAFTVTLRDSAGAERSVIIPRGTGPLTWHPGEVEEWGGEYFWVGHMPLGDLRIPLMYFIGLDLSAITSLTISFDQTPSGAVMLSDVFLK